MMPIASCLFLRGKCRYCKVRFGFTHAIFEAVFGVIFALLAYKFHIGTKPLSLLELKDLLFQIVVVLTLGVIFLYDLRQKIIPSVFLYLFLTLSLIPLLSRLSGEFSSFELASPLLVALPYLILFLLTMGKGVGFGDVLLFAGVGGMLGLDKGILVFLLSLWIGTLTVIPLLFAKVLTKKSAIPFAPFIIVSYLLVLFTDWSVSDLISLIYRAML